MYTYIYTKSGNPLYWITAYVYSSKIIKNGPKIILYATCHRNDHRL